MMVMTMTTDIAIEQIADIYYLKQADWKRNQPLPRGLNGVSLFTEGEIEYDFDGQTLVARKGDLLLLPANVPYTGKRRTDTVAFFVCDFSCDSPEAFAAFGAPAVVHASDFDRLCDRFARAIDRWETQQADVNLRLKSFLYTVLCEALQDTGAPKVTPTEDILAYIVEHIDDPALSVSHLCKQFYASESQLRRNIRKATGLNPNEYMLRLRINKAKMLLSRSDESVKQIAAICGFSSPYYFSRCFTAQTGLSPTSYRKEHPAI